jgi:hypothetical protein
MLHERQGLAMRLPKAVILTVILGSASHLLGQVQTHTKKENTLYAKALFASVAEMQKQYGEQKEAPDYHHMFVEADPSITDGLPSESAGYRIEYLDDKGQTARYQKLKREYPILKIFPIEDEGATLKVGITVYYFSYKNRRLMYALSDWSNVEFRFDCDKQEFVISSVKLGGI